MAEKEGARKAGQRRASSREESYRRFADKIIDQIKRGTAPWQKSWKAGERSLPQNVSTGRRGRSKTDG